MPLTATKPCLSVEDYLAVEDGAEVRHEYIAGQVYALTGSSDRHGLITMNLAARLHQLTRGGPCQLFANDMKVRLLIDGDDIFYYPDLLLACDPDDRATYYRRNPCLLVEVLSPSTARLDRREKYWAYKTLPSLREYLLISQDEPWVQCHRRANDWQPEVLTTGAVQLDCVDAAIDLDLIFE
ncbi:Uma2 family endonuclease, partial [Thiohalocapsa marina]|uniref:Uma2 family endonuclease n=1 Tax=Thiohalocapsa marina TaxID=424902 RepID=UPI0036DB0C09